MQDGLCSAVFIVHFSSPASAGTDVWTQGQQTPHRAGTGSALAAGERKEGREIKSYRKKTPFSYVVSRFDFPQIVTVNLRSVSVCSARFWSSVRSVLYAEPRVEMNSAELVQTSRTSTHQFK